MCSWEKGFEIKLRLDPEEFLAKNDKEE